MFLVQIVSQLCCPLAKQKRTKLFTKCLPSKWDYILLSLVELSFTYQFCFLSPRVFKIFLKCGKLQCKQNFNINEVCLVMREHIEANRQVLYLSGGYMMNLETPWHVSHVTCQVSHVTLQPIPNRKN